MKSNDLEWKEYTFSNVVEVNPKRILKKGEIAPFIEMKALNPSKREVEFIGQREFKGGGSKFQNEDTIFARITPCLENGKTAFINELKDGQVGNGSTEFIVLSGKEGITDNLFIYYLSRWDEVRGFAVQAMTGTSGRQRVPNNAFDYLKISIPPLPEQRRIAEILGALDDKIELNQRMNKALEEMAQAIFKHWFVDFEFPNEDGEPYKSSGGEMVYSEELEKEVPKGWEVGKLGEIADFLNGVPCQKFPTKEGEPSLPVIKIRELRNGFSENTDRANLQIPEKYIIEDGDVLFSWSATLLVKLWYGGRGLLNQHIFKVSSETFPKWFYYLWTKHHIERFQQIASDKVTTMGHIQRHHLNEAMVIIPDDKVFENMTKILAPLIDQQIENAKQSRNLAAIRDALLPKLMSGEIRVRIPEEPKDGIEAVEQFPEKVEPAPAVRKFQPFREAVLVAGLVDEFSNPEYPLGRFRYTKFSYFTKRHLGEDVTAQYAKMTAGPYDHRVRYQGPEKIALEKGYIKKAGAKSFLAGSNISQTEEYIERYGLKESIEWVATELRYETNEMLELLSTIDYTVLELQGVGEKINPALIRKYIESYSEWTKKLEKEVFSPKNIRKGLRKLQKLFPETYRNIRTQEE